MHIRLSQFKSGLWLAVICAAVLVAGTIALAGDQLRNIQLLVGHSVSQVSSAVDMPFSLYIGDDLSGITDPVKSAYFTISGVYTGDGTLEVTIDDDAATSKTFTLPNVTAPTSFEFQYQDPSNKINPATPGSYDYTLNLNPSGVTISGLSAISELTYRYSAQTCPDGSELVEKLKTTDLLVGHSVSQVSSAVDMPFSLYIGDDLSGITDPVKSAYFTISGVYTGDGTLEVTIDDDAATSKTFTLPNVTAPTSFEFQYQDPSNKINPATPGSYDYTLNLNPSGVTISGLNSALIETHQYKPPACGAGYPATGDIVSMVYDTAIPGGAAYNSIMWRGQLGGPGMNQGKVRLQLAASASSSGPWNFYGPACIGGASDWFEADSDVAVEVSCPSQLNNKRYFKYKLRLCADDCVLAGSYTPRVDDVHVNWSP